MEQKKEWEEFADKFIVTCFTHPNVSKEILLNKYPESKVRKIINDLFNLSHYLYATSWILEVDFERKYWISYNDDKNKFKENITHDLIPYYDTFKEITDGHYSIKWMFDARRNNNKITKYFDYLYNPDDDYIKFIRYGQYCIHNNNEGILAFISNNSFNFNVF